MKKTASVYYYCRYLALRRHQNLLAIIYHLSIIKCSQLISVSISVGNTACNTKMMTL